MLENDKKQGMNGGQRKIHNKELHNMNYSSNIAREFKKRVRWAKHVACIVELRDALRIRVMIPGGKRQFGRPGCGWRK